MGSGPGSARPFTGAEYLESLKDGREVYIYGERIKDVTTHPAFRNAARTIARLYDALHDPKQKAVLTCPTDTGSGSFTHKFFRVAHSREDLIGQCDAIAHWARLSYGWMGRSPDYKASLTNALGANSAFYEKFAANATNWYARSHNHVLFMNHAIVNPPVDRMKPPDQIKDVFISIQKETDAGIVVSGAKAVATSAAITHYNFMGQNVAIPLNDTDLAVMFITPLNAPGVKIICRTSYEMTAQVIGTPFDYPLSSRFDENDAICRQPRGYPHPCVAQRQRLWRLRGHDWAGRTMHGRLRRQRLDWRHLDGQGLDRQALDRQGLDEQGLGRSEQPWEHVRQLCVVRGALGSHPPKESPTLRL